MHVIVDIGFVRRLDGRVTMAVGSTNGCGSSLTGRWTLMQALVFHAWNYVFDHRVSPLRHIPDVATRHWILQILGWMWALAFCVAIGSYSGFFVSAIGHAVLIGAAGLTVATYTVAAQRPRTFDRYSGRRGDGEHE